MSVYHSPRCRIAWTNVDSNGVDRDVVIPDRPMTLFFGLNFDNNIRVRAGYFGLAFSLVQGSQLYGHTWSGWISRELPGTTGSIWVSYSWARATDATDGRRGLFLYRPTVAFLLIPPGGGLTGDDEFAVAEEDHYILFE